MSDPLAALDAAYVAAVERGDNDQARLLEQAQGQADQPPRAGIDVAVSAVWYARRGLRVFPLMPGQKRPYPGSNGVTDATTDEHQLANWFGMALDPRDPHNIGVATGEKFDVIDIDGPDGVEAFRGMLSGGSGWLVVRGVTQTPRGLHLWVPAVPEARNAAYADGLDYRAAGGYVVVPPSHVEGTLYRWLLPPVT
jgi:hypothetical protein